MTVPFTEPLKREEDRFRNSTSPPIMPHVKLLPFSGLDFFFFTLTLQSHFNQKTRETSLTSITIVSSLHLKNSFREINKILSMVIHRHTHRLPHTIAICCGARPPKILAQHYHTGALCTLSTDLFCVEENWSHCFKEELLKVAKTIQHLVLSVFQQHLSHHCGREFAIHPECLYSHLLHFKR